MSIRTLPLPFWLAVAFTTAVEGLGLTEFVPVPVALLAGAAWGAGTGLVAIWISRKTRPSAWVEDVLVGLGVVAMAFFAFGGFTGILLLSSALDSSSLTGETLVTMFLPSIYLVFSSDRLDFAGTERSTTPLTQAQRDQLATDLHLDDPRPILNFVIFAVFLLAAHFSRVRELR
jgi:hypothetical protein